MNRCPGAGAYRVRRASIIGGGRGVVRGEKGALLVNLNRWDRGGRGRDRRGEGLKQSVLRRRGQGGWLPRADRDNRSPTQNREEEGVGATKGVRGGGR